MAQRGSKPGERRGGRQKGTPNGATIAKFVKTAAATDKIRLTVARVLEEYAHLATLDIGEAFAPDGSLLPIHEMPEHVRRALAGVEVSELMVDGDGKGPVGKLHKLKFYDKRAALADIAKHLGMFIERIGNPDGTPLLGEVRIRLVEAVNGRRADQAMIDK
jgi:hypothetical protein